MGIVLYVRVLSFGRICCVNHSYRPRYRVRKGGVMEQMAKVIQFDKKKDDPKCSFCGTKMSASKHFWQSSGKCICGKCVAKAKMLLDEEVE